MAARGRSSADGATDTDAQLRTLVARGFRFIDPRDDNGDILAVVGIRAHDDVIDVVRLNSEDDVVASRMPADDDVMAPRRLLWQEAGSADLVLGAMLALPDRQLIVPGRVSA
ncbi:hypothetical protein [Actinophytocola sediminis]